MDRTLAFIQSEMRRQLAPVYSPRELQQVVSELLEHFGFTRVQVIAYPDAKLSETDYEQLQLMLKRLADGEPLQYVVGTEWFMDMPFSVCRDVLIPRPETEELVRLIVGCCKQPSPRIVDVGTGSGCIAVLLAKLIDGAQVTAIDVSAAAIEVARRNAEQNSAQVEFVRADILADNQLFAPSSLDVVVSNPPYVTETDKNQMSRNVLDFEPHLALFVPDSDPLLFYRRIAELAQQWLKSGGMLFFEINERFGPETVQLLENMRFDNVELHRDFYEKNRMVSAVWNAK
ncbi:MAG: peptide chain release factor N(5)-glutamine methyltransferase [Salinivirgaceae bacterium]|nr:peptide chain release factor N(5)-glutamine methyltransferase [Salinivirgaceae bacterium]